MKGNIVIIAFFVVLFLIATGVVFAIYKLASSDSEPEPAVSIEIAAEKEMFKNKLDAYNKQIQDSLLLIRDENVKVNLKRLWERKVKKDTAELEELFQEAMEENEGVVEKPQPSRQKEVGKIPKTSMPVRELHSQEKEHMTYVVREDTAPSVKKAYTPKSGLYSSFQEQVASDNPYVVIKAVIHERQKVTSNTNVKFRLMQEIILNGISIPEGTFVFGKADLSNERVLVRFENFSYKGKLLPFKYSVYDNDGWEGIYVPGLNINEISQDVINQMANQGSSKVNIPVIGSVAVNSINKSNNEASAILSENYPVILKIQ